MRNRREFLKDFAGASAGAFLLGKDSFLHAAYWLPGGPQAAPPASAAATAVKRREIKVGGKLRSNATITFSHVPFPNPDLRVHMDAMAKRIGFPQQAIAHD